MTNVPVVGAPAPQKPSRPWLIYILIAAAACVPLAGIFAALAIYGVRKYIANAKQAEGRAAVMALSAGIAGCTSARASNGTAALPPSSDPVPRAITDVSGRKYMSSPSEWSGDAYSCAKFVMSDPQYFQYQWEKLSDTEGRSTARADLDGDSVAEIEFEVAVTCSGGQCSAGPLSE
jgi:type IV pilus assembly protein PilA